MSITLCSYNVRGIGSAIKREQIFAWLKDKKFDICLLQETHSVEENRELWEREWGKYCFFSGKSTNSEGVGILLNPNLSCEILDHIELVSGRLQALEIKIQEKLVTILNIYGPNKDEIDIFEILELYISTHEDKNFIIGGDFNTVLDIHLDKKNGKLDTHKRCRQKITNILETYDLTDIWRDKHPTLKHFTWHSSHKPPIFCRLDYFLISKNIANTVVSCEHNFSYKSDHSIVKLTIDTNSYERGPGYFKLNNSLILDNEYQQTIKESIKEIATMNKDANPNTLWEIIKGTVRNETIKYASLKKKENLKNEIKYTKDIEQLERELSNADDSELHDRIKSNLDSKRNELNKILENRLNGYIIRSKAQIIEQNEKNNKYFAGLEKKKSEAKAITRLNINNTVVTNQRTILLEQKKFYEQLYSKIEQIESDINFFDNSLPKLNENEQNSCEGHITELECKTALKDMKNQKSPGSDGLTTEFYKIFWNDIKEYYIKSINFSFQNGELTELQKQSIITLLPKSGKDNLLLENWRPISLLNVDYKITVKAIANRIKKVLPTLIHETQTGFMKGRYIGENIRLILEAIDITDENNLPGMIFFSDFEKAFDSINHEYMFKCLRHFNFKNDLVNWVKLLYKNAKSCVTNNGHHSDFFHIWRGVRQGCPLSPYLFIICIELLSNQVRKSPDIKGIYIEGKENKTSLFADDASFILDGSTKSFENLIRILDKFTNISGLKLNAKKCQVLRIGSLTSKTIELMKHRKFSWNSNKASCLGMVFKTNREKSLSSNLEPKIIEFEKCLMQWRHRKLSLMGKIVVIKSYALPKLIYPLTSLPNPPKETIKRIEKMMYNFIWDGKPDKIKREILTSDYDKGGLRMIDIEKFIWSLKISWVKRILQTESNSLLKHLYENVFKQFGGNILFECNFREADIIKHFNKKPFLRDLLLAWSKFANKTVISNYHNEIIWNNSNIRVGENTIFYKEWFQLGIKHIKDIYDQQNQRYYSFYQLQEKFNLPATEFLRYMSLINSIPKDWKYKLKHEIQIVPTESNLLKQIRNQTHVNKFVYNNFMRCSQGAVSKAEIKWNEQFSDETLQWKNIYLTVFKSTNDIKLRNFQYKYLMRIVPTNQFLTKCNIVGSALCEFCSMEIETVSHLFWECAHVQQFWTSVADLLRVCDSNINITVKTITFGICQSKPKCDAIVINFIIFLAKYFIFQNKQNKKVPNMHVFKYYLSNRIKIEKEIALLNDKLAFFEYKWGKVLDKLNMK